MRMHLRLALFSAFLVAAAAPAAARGADPVIVRPTDGGDYAYTTAEAAPYVGASAVVHYVTTGPDAPPLDDADASGWPDYVEEAARAADRALGYYRGRGFRPPTPDTGGPDAKPDIYVKVPGEQLFGVAFSPTKSVKESFVLISPDLDPMPERPVVSLQVTVAHELFHLVQYAYVGGGAFPAWAAEGTAVAMQMRVFPEIQEALTRDLLRAWLKEPWRPLHDGREHCGRCYGAAWWWNYLLARSPNLLTAYFERLSTVKRQRKPIYWGLRQLDELLVARGLGSLNEAYGRFSLSLHRRGLALGAAYKVTTIGRLRATRTLPVFRLSAQYVPVYVRSRERGIYLLIAHARDSRPLASLVLGGASGREVRARTLPSGRLSVLRTTFRSERERKNVRLILSSGIENGVKYALIGRTFRNERIPRWIWYRGELP
jgi:hypothetical protein